MKFQSKSSKKRFLSKIASVSFFLTLTFLVNVSSILGQEISTSGVSLQKQNHEDKALAPLTTRVKRGVLPYSKIFRNIKPEPGKLRLLPPLSEEEKLGIEPDFLAEPSVKPLKIGAVRKLSQSLDLENLGKTYVLSDGFVSVMAVKSPGSLMTRLHFIDFDLPEGASLFVYSAKKPDDVHSVSEGQAIGGKRDFWTPPVAGDEVIIEYFNPNKNSVNEPTPFIIAAVSHMFKDPLLYSSPEEDFCHNNIPSQWTETAKSVGGIDFIDRETQLYCTGTLLTNQSVDFTPFFLTANHCGITSANAQSVRIWWNFDIAGQSLTSKPHSDVTKLLANKDAISGTDFALLQILGSLPTSAYFSGWTTIMPGFLTGVVGIHHPDGAYKRISYGGIGTSFDCPSSQITCANFLPVDWNNIGGGTTESGSSGSGLWLNNSSNPQLVGQLFGGAASCSNPNSNDYYGRFDLTYAQISSYMNGTWSEFDDLLEQNDSRAAARAVLNNTFYGNLKVKYADEDWYKVSVPTGSKVTFSANFEHDYGDIDINLYRGSDISPVASSESVGDSELVEQTNTGAVTDYFLRVHLSGNAIYTSTRNTYNMSVTVQGGQPVTPGKKLFDFDGDGKSDYGVFRPSSGYWFLQNSTSGYSQSQFGLTTDKIAPADFDGDGKTDIAVYRAGNWYLQRSSAGLTVVQFGLANDVPVPADYNGDGKADLAVYRPSNGVWYILNGTTNQYTIQQWGESTDKPVTADYDGDGKSDYAVYRPATGYWYIMRSRDGIFSIQFGTSTDKPVVGDYDGDGKADLAVYRPSNSVWYIMQSSQQGYISIPFGISTDLPVPGDYDGDGKTNVAVWRPNGGMYYILRNNSNVYDAFHFGENGDKPVASAFVP